MTYLVERLAELRRYLMLNGRKLRSIAAGILLLAIGFVAGRFAAPDPYDELVERIARTPQTYDGEIIDNLTALGLPAVPAIGRALGRDQPFPMVFVTALERIAEPKGMKPILAFLAKQAPFADQDRSFLTAATILALRAFATRTHAIRWPESSATTRRIPEFAWPRPPRSPICAPVTSSATRRSSFSANSPFA